MRRRLLGRTPKLTDQQVIAAAAIIARGRKRDGAGEAETVVDLRAAGFDEGQARRFIDLLPMAFSRPVLEHFGVQVTGTVIAVTAAGEELQFRLDRQPEYVAGLALARRHRDAPCLPDGVYETITGSSSEIDAISKALNEGMDMEGSVVTSALVSSDLVRFLLR